MEKKLLAMNNEEAEIKAILNELRSILEDTVKALENTNKKDNEIILRRGVK
jgi:hypothetical protein